MIRIAILIGMVVGLAIIIYRWNKKRQTTGRVQNPLFETQDPTPSTPEEEIVLRLLDKIEGASTPLYFGTFQSRHVFSNGHFLEFADKLPLAIEQLRDLYVQYLPEDTIKSVIPADTDNLAEEVQAVKEIAGKYELSSRTNRSIVDRTYYDYLKMRYPNAKVFCRGRTQPVTFSQGGVIRAVLMPMKQ